MPDENRGSAAILIILLSSCRVLTADAEFQVLGSGAGVVVFLGLNV